MAILYVDDDGSNTSPFDTWAKAATTLGAALADAACVAGSIVYVIDTHAENAGATATLASAGTITEPVKVICVSSLAHEPPTEGDISTTAQVRTNGNYAITFTGYGYFYGIDFQTSSGGGANSGGDFNFLASSADGGLYFENCTFTISSTSASAIFNFGTTSGYERYYRFENCTCSFGAAGQYFEMVQGKWLWENSNTNAIGGTVPTTKVVNCTQTAYQSSLVWRGLDLDQLTSSSYIFNASGDAAFDALLENCKLGGANISVAVNPITGPGAARIRAHNCSSADNNYSFYEIGYLGINEHATNCKLNADFSIKMTSSAGTTYTQPLTSPQIAIYNTTTTAQSATIECISTDLLKDDEIWVELEYSVDAGDPLTAIVTDRHTHHLTSLQTASSGSNQDASTASWTEDLVGEDKFKLVIATFTAANPGYLIARVKLAKASTTVYIDPVITLAAA